MKYEYTMRADNVYMIDTKMFGFDNYNAAYIVEGKEIALIDTGLPPQIEAVRSGIKAHGFSISDISYIFITHCEHPDHSGNVAPLLRESPQAQVYINPVGLEYLTNPSIESEKRKAVLLPQMAARFGEMEPVPPSRIKFLKDGDVFDLGNGEKLKIIFTPGHQPSGIAILSEKSKGMFINDLIGSYYEDADYLLVAIPKGSDLIENMNSLKKLMNISATRLFISHFGICDKPKIVIQRALDCIQHLLDIGAQCTKEGKPDEIATKVLETYSLEVEKLKQTRGDAVYKFMKEELLPSWSTAFARYYLDLNGGKIV